LSVLEIANAPHAASRLDDDEKSTIAINDSGNLNDLRTIISESGLYSLVLTSRKPEAKVFKRWVTGTVLTTLRKTGTYTAPTALPAPKGAGAWAEAMFRYGVPSNSHQEDPGPAATSPLGDQSLAAHKDVEHVFRSWKPSETA
jgi:hypothetical protein